jgi:hypothetical protein
MEPAQAIEAGAEVCAADVARDRARPAIGECVSSDENADMTRTTKPRCFLVYVLAPEGTSHAEANQLFNLFVGDRRLPLVVFHDHFIGRPGGVAIFFAKTPREQEALTQSEWLNGWQVDIHPLIFSHSPAAFDEQIAFTLRVYRGLEWERVQRQERPDYSDRGSE